MNNLNNALEEALICIEMGEFELAESCLKTAETELPPEARVHLHAMHALFSEKAAHYFFNRGNTLYQRYQLEKAIEAYQKALAFSPQNPETTLNLSIAFNEIGNYCASRECLESLFLTPMESPEIAFALGLRHLLAGEYQAGWPLWERRFEVNSLQSSLGFFHLLGFTPWKGEPFHSQTLVLWAEQGLGDTLQMARFLPRVLDLGSEVVCYVQPSVLNLLADSFPLPRLSFKPLDQPSESTQCLGRSLMSLPACFDIQSADLPCTAFPYLRVNTSKQAYWVEKCAQLGAGAKIGLVWAGNPHKARDALRSLPFDALLPLLKIGGIHWISLQKQDNAIAHPALVDWTEALHDFSDTAALVSALDAVISVDTAVVHLAGALNKKAFLLNAHHSEWRWGRGLSHSRWYPSIEIFTQSVPFEWSDVIEKLCARIEAFN